MVRLGRRIQRAHAAREGAQAGPKTREEAGTGGGPADGWPTQPASLAARELACFAGLGYCAIGTRFLPEGGASLSVRVEASTTEARTASDSFKFAAGPPLSRPLFSLRPDRHGRFSLSLLPHTFPLAVPVRAPRQEHLSSCGCARRVPSVFTRCCCRPATPIARVVLHPRRHGLSCRPSVWPLCH